jgi:hypothetical protein
VRRDAAPEVKTPCRRADRLLTGRAGIRRTVRHRIA